MCGSSARRNNADHSKVVKLTDPLRSLQLSEPFHSNFLVNFPTVPVEVH